MPSKRALLPQLLRMEILWGPAASGVELVRSRRSRGESAGQGLHGGTGGVALRRVLAPLGRESGGARGIGRIRRAPAQGFAAGFGDQRAWREGRGNHGFRMRSEVMKIHVIHLNLQAIAAGTRGGEDFKLRERREGRGGIRFAEALQCSCRPARRPHHSPRALAHRFASPVHQEIWLPHSGWYCQGRPGRTNPGPASPKRAWSFSRNTPAQ